MYGEYDLLCGESANAKEFSDPDELRAKFEHFAQLPAAPVEQWVDVAETKERVEPHPFQQVERKIGHGILSKIPLFEDEARDDGGFARMAGGAEVAAKVVAVAESVTVLGFHSYPASRAAIVLFGHHHFETDE